MTRADLQKRLILLGTGGLADAQAHRGGQDNSFRVVQEFDINREPIGDLVKHLHEHSANVVLISAGHTKFDVIEQVINACELEVESGWRPTFLTRRLPARRSTIFTVCRCLFFIPPTASLQGLAKQGIDFVGAFFMLLL